MELGASQINGLHVSGGRRQPIRTIDAVRRHRIDEILQEEGISLRSIAHRMGVTTAQAKSEADPLFDLTLTALHRWQAALGVPIGDLLTPPGMLLSAAIGLRAKLLNAMRTVRSIQLRVDDEPTQALAITLAQQMLEIMPELKSITAWPTVGTRRKLNDFGVIANRTLPDEFFEATD
jgi:hypothetical protein